MYEEFVPERLAKLRLQKGVSARDMSLSLGQANNYINNIENKKSLPAMQSFFYICEYLGVTPQEFFDEENFYPETLQEFIAEAKKHAEAAKVSEENETGFQINDIYPRHYERAEQQEVKRSRNGRFLLIISYAVLN